MTEKYKDIDDLFNKHTQSGSLNSLYFKFQMAKFLEDKYKTTNSKKVKQFILDICPSLEYKVKE